MVNLDHKDSLVSLDHQDHWVVLDLRESKDPLDLLDKEVRSLKASDFKLERQNRNREK